MKPFKPCAWALTDFLTKPSDPQHLCLLVERALRERTLQDELAALRARLASGMRSGISLASALGCSKSSS